MRINNFKLIEFDNQQIIELEYLGVIYDLHNAAEFIKIDFIIQSSVLRLFWNYYFDENHVFPVQLRFEGVESILVLPNNNEACREEDICLEEIIYDNNMELRFMGGMIIVVKADDVSFEK